LMLLMGVASPYWLRAIDTAGTYLSQQPHISPAAEARVPHPSQSHREGWDEEIQPNSNTVAEGGQR
jgi:hypothetical protein